MKPDFHKYIILWLSQSVSQLGSAMTSFALILWAYQQHGSALTVSLMSFYNYVPYILVGLFAGTFVDSHSKKHIMLTADIVAAACSLAVLALSGLGLLRTGHIYLINGIIGTAEAFQLPASSVAVGRLVPEEKLVNASGMQSFSGNLVGIFAPVISAALYGWYGLKPVLMLDLASFFAAFFVLFFFISIPEPDDMTSSDAVASQNPVKMIYIPAALSFLCGDLMLAAGRETWIWCVAGIFSSLPIPFINAGQNLILYQQIPDEMRGRVFSARNALQLGTIPPALLLGGFLADQVMEPMMAAAERFPASALSVLVGSGPGSGMAAMFLFTGVFGSIFCVAVSKRKEIKGLYSGEGK